MYTSMTNGYKMYIIGFRNPVPELPARWMIVPSVNIVFDDLRGAQVGYTGTLGTLLPIGKYYHNIVRSPHPDPIMGSRSRDFR